MNLIHNNMNEGERLFFLVIAVALAYGVGCLGKTRKIGFGWAFFLSLINIFLGLIVVFCSKKKKNDVDFVDVNKEDDK